MGKTPKGYFVWHELLTSDPTAAQTFYKKVVGWTTDKWGPDGTYTLWVSEAGPVGGCMAMPAEVKAMGAPPHWLTYVGTPDIDATAAHAKRLGGKVMKGPEDVPGVGRYAVLSDPQGAVFCLYQSGDDPGGHDAPPKVGQFSWHELATTDPKGAWAFYSELFGWEKAGEMDMGPGGVYQMYGFGGVPMGGIYAKPPEVPVANWLPYAKVKNADASADTTKASGGMVMVEPMDVPGGSGDRIAVAQDPQGAVFAVHSSNG